MSESFYNILGVNEKATKDEIKKAYRGLQMKFHPDKNPNNPDAMNMTQKINEAYETLGDDQKRQEYDARNNNPFFRMGGMGGFQQGGQEMPINIDELFGNIFGGGNPFFMPGAMGGFPGMPQGSRIHVFRGAPGMNFHEAEQKPAPIIKTLVINIEQILSDSTVPVDIERWILENGNKTFETEVVYVKIPKGSDDNEIIIIRDKGNVISENCKGDIKLFLKVQNNTQFKRNGLDLILEKRISLKDALCGLSFEIKHVNGRLYTINNIAGNIIPHNYNKIIPDMGLMRENHIGNLIIRFEIDYPEKLSIEQIDKLREIL